jgi:acyl-CoA thioester hydrolase
VTDAHRTRVRARYAETDQMGVVHHSVWPLYWELGRTDLLRSRAKSYADLEREDGILFPVIDYGVEILAPVRYDDEIEIRTRLAEQGRVKLRFDYEGWVSGELVCRGHSVHGVLDKDWRATRLPADIARRLAGE